MSRLALLGFDGLDPELVERWLGDLPNLSELMSEGIHGKLESTYPPTTIPAWTSMMTSQDPGQIGLYDRRRRIGRSYKYETVDSMAIRQKTIWNYTSRVRLEALLVGVPQTFPPKPLKGSLVSGLLTPNKELQWTYPRELANEVENAVGGDFPFDVYGYQTKNKDWLVEKVYDMTRKRLGTFRHFARKREHDLLMMVEHGADRIQHGFWRHMDEEHPNFVPESRFAEVIHDYYVFLDQEIGKLLEDLPRDTSVMLVSPFSSQPLKGCVRLNEWLQQEGYLVLNEEAKEGEPLDLKQVDWTQTEAWADGGAVGQIHFNVHGREPNGFVPAEEIENLKNDIRERVMTIEQDGARVSSIAEAPEQMYRAANGNGPDLIVKFEDLTYLVSPVMGGEIIQSENDAGPDDTTHRGEGLFIWDHPAKMEPKKKDTYSIYDIAPTILTYFGIDVPEHMIGESLISL